MYIYTHEKPLLSLPHNQHYLNRYFKLINHFKILNLKKKNTELYCEAHHIIPICMGGNNDHINLVILPAKAHFIAHWILWKAFGHKLSNAFMMMKVNNETNNREFFNVTGKVYQSLREDFSLSMSERKTGKPNNSWNTGLTKESSHKLMEVANKISNSVKGMKFWTNGINTTKSFICPADWYNGRTGHFKFSDDQKKIIKERMSGGVSSWWNNSIINKRCKEKPDGINWIKGRLKSSMSDTFINNKSYLIKYNIFIIKNLLTNEEITLNNKEYKDFEKTTSVANGLKPRKRSYDKKSIWVLILKS